MPFVCASSAHWWLAKEILDVIKASWLDNHRDLHLSRISASDLLPARFQRVRIHLGVSRARKGGKIRRVSYPNNTVP